MIKEKTQKLSEEEVQKIKDFQNESNNLTYSLGQIEVQKLILENQKQDLISQLNKSQQLQEEFSTSLQEKYGNGNINLETGEFTAVE